MCPQKLLLPHTASFVSILGPSNEFPQYQRQISALPPFLIVADLLQPSSRQGGWCLHQLALMVIPRGPTDWTIGCSLTLLNYCLVFFNFCLFGFAFILNFITCMCAYVSVCVCICWGHMTTFRSLFSSTVWVLGTELRQSCLARAFLNGSSLVLSPLFLSPTTTSFFFLPLFYFLAFFKHVALSLLQLQTSVRPNTQASSGTFLPPHVWQSVRRLWRATSQYVCLFSRMWIKSEAWS